MNRNKRRSRSSGQTISGDQPASAESAGESLRETRLIEAMTIGWLLAVATLCLIEILAMLIVGYAASFLDDKSDSTFTVAGALAVQSGLVLGPIVLVSTLLLRRLRQHPIPPPLFWAALLLSIATLPNYALARWLLG